MQLPAVEIVDMCDELKQGNRTAISGRLYDELERTLQVGKQAMLFLNRRGYSTFVMCRSCGYVVKCDSCDVTMTYHKSQDILKCHYCGRTKTPETTCPECGKPHLKYFGTGTQQIEEQVKPVSYTHLDVYKRQVEDNGLKQIDNADEILTMVQQIIKDNPKPVADYKGGNAKAMTFFVGQVMKATKGKANPKTVNELVKAELDKA